MGIYEKLTGPSGEISIGGTRHPDCPVVCGIFTWLTTPSMSTLTNIDGMVV